MDSDFSEKLKKVLSDPEAMSKIMAVASSMGATEAQRKEAPAPSDSEAASGSSEGPFALLGGLSADSDPRIALLNTVKPLLREDKRSRIDSLTRALTAVSVMKNLRK